MAERNGVITRYNPSNQQGFIQPDDKGPEVKFFLKVVQDKEIVPQVGDKVSFEAPPPSKNSKGKPFQADATSVTIIERQQAAAPPTQSATAATTVSVTIRNQQAPSPNYGLPRFSDFSYDLPSLQHQVVESSPRDANLGLLLDKYVGHKINERNGAKDIGKDWLKQVFIPQYYRAVELGEYTNLFGSFYQRWIKLLEGQQAKTQIMVTNWRLAMHLGRTTVIENATIALHRTHGFPFIPGQSIKGLAHAYAEMVEFPNEPEMVQRLFGTQEAEGSVVFLDAIPTRLPNLELDILNPHFPKWYGGTDLPSDNQSPIPVNFLTVAPDSEFLFAVTPVSNQLGRENSEADCKLVLRLLGDALNQLGIGAKTAAGYGQFVKRG